MLLLQDDQPNNRSEFQRGHQGSAHEVYRGTEKLHERFSGYILTDFHG
jgi:hypothetical protein